MHYKRIAAASLMAVSLTGCATIIKGSTQSIAISSPPATGAVCNVNNSDGNWQVTTPGSVSVERSTSNIQIQCTKPGYQTASTVVPAHFNGWMLGDIIFGGLIGIVVDASTSASESYPDTAQVPMTQSRTSGQPDANQTQPYNGS